MKKISKVINISNKFDKKIIDGNLALNLENNDYTVPKAKKIMKSLKKYFTSLDIWNKYKSVTIHINNDNILSKKVFNHIGFKSIGNTLYNIEIINLKKWSNM